MKTVVIEFINNHWDEVVNLEKDYYYTQEQILKLVKKDKNYLEWVFSEIMVWGTHINYTEQFKIEHYNQDEYKVYKIKNKYYRWHYDNNSFQILKPKYKKILCFE